MSNVIAKSNIAAQTTIGKMNAQLALMAGTFQAEAAFSTFAQNHWMKVGEEDLKYALRELGEGKNEGANYSALLARCL
jgi:hypothetical protein